MTFLAWVAFALLAGAALGLTFWLYLRREPPGRGRPLLALLRAAALVLVLLLLFDPELPGRPGRAADRSPAVLLDASASMALPRSPGDTAPRWIAAAAEARARARGRPVLLFGDAPRPLHPDSLPAVAPGDGSSRLLPALRAAAEAGARRVVVITDGQLEDAASLAAWQPRLGLDIEWERVGQPLPGAGLVEVSAPAWARAGEPVDVQVVVQSQGAGTGTRRVVVRQAGRVLAEAEAPIPAQGRIARLTLPVRPAAAEELVRLDVALEPGDALAVDDRRAVLLHVSAEPPGIVLISSRPDWEPRFLLPVLERTLGLPAQGFLQVAPGVWSRLGDGNAAGRRVSEGDVARAARAADLLVLHAPPATLVPWLREAHATAPASLVLATGTGTELPGVPSTLVRDDWFATDPLPASPVAGLLAGVSLAEAPPLAALLTAELPPGAWAPLLATRRRAGRPFPVVAAGSEAGRRWAVGLAQGYWRWAFQPGEPRELYERLWAAVGGWLVADAAAPSLGAVRPAARVLPRDQASAWVAAGMIADSIRLRLRADAGAGLDTLLVRSVADTLPGPKLAPGSWRWRATAYGGGRSANGAGELFVEPYSEELSRPYIRLETLRAGDPVGRVEDRARGLAPLHARPWPWVLIVLLLATEWVLRRRWGLR